MDVLELQNLLPEEITGYTWGRDLVKGDVHLWEPFPAYDPPQYGERLMSSICGVFRKRSALGLERGSGPPCFDCMRVLRGDPICSPLCSP